MATRKVQIEFGGAVRTLRYRVVDDRKDIERSFGGQHLRVIVDQILLGIDPALPNATAFENFTLRGSLEALAVFLWVGIRHENPREITLDVTKAWLEEYVVDKEQPAYNLAAKVAEAVGLSGMFGIIYDIIESSKKVAAGDAPKLPSPEQIEAGKEQSSSSPSTPTSSISTSGVEPSASA